MRHALEALSIRGLDADRGVQGDPAVAPPEHPAQALAPEVPEVSEDAPAKTLPPWIGLGFGQGGGRPGRSAAF